MLDCFWMLECVRITTVPCVSDVSKAFTSSLEHVNRSSFPAVAAKAHRLRHQAAQVRNSVIQQSAKLSDDGLDGTNRPQPMLLREHQVCLILQLHFDGLMH